MITVRDSLVRASMQYDDYYEWLRSAAILLTLADSKMLTRLARAYIRGSETLSSIMPRDRLVTEDEKDVADWYASAMNGHMTVRPEAIEFDAAIEWLYLFPYAIDRLFSSRLAWGLPLAMECG